jgi:hypothetical protein
MNHGADFVCVHDHVMNQQYDSEHNSTITKHGTYVAIYEHDLKKSS